MSSSSSSDPSSGSTTTSSSDPSSASSSYPPTSSSESGSGTTEVSTSTLPVVTEDEGCDDMESVGHKSRKWGSLTSLNTVLFPDFG